MHCQSGEVHGAESYVWVLQLPLGSQYCKEPTRPEDQVSVTSSFNLMFQTLESVMTLSGPLFFHMSNPKVTSNTNFDVSIFRVSQNIYVPISFYKSF